MKLHDLHEGIQSRTLRTRRKRQLGQAIHTFDDLVQEVASALIPIIEQDEANIYQSIRNDPAVPDDELPPSVEDHFRTVSEFFLIEGFEQSLTQAVHNLWDKKWNTE